MGNGPLELTPIQLQAAHGTLMLTSIPDGAAVSINGKRTNYSTPAQIPLGLGSVHGDDREGRAAGLGERRNQGRYYDAEVRARTVGWWSGLSSSARCFSPIADQSKFRSATP